MLKRLKIFGLVFVLLMIIGCNYVKDFEVVEDFSIELGEELPQGVINYLRGIDQLDVSKEAELVLPEVEKEYLDLGEYTVKVNFRGETKEIKARVVDTVSPEFVDFIDKIEVEYGSKIDWNDKYNATDLTDVTVSVDDSMVNYDESGIYKVLVSATDTSGNTTVREVEVTVKEEVKVVTTTINSGNTRNTSSNISNGKGITLKQGGINNPAYYDFGKYQDYATEIYNTILNQDTFKMEFNFDTHEESVAFSTKFNSTVLPVDVCLYEIHYSANERIVETGEWVEVHKIIYDSSNFKGRIDLRKALTMSYDACISAGLYNGMSEKEAVGKISRWIINHMTYELNNGEAYVGFTTGRGQCHTYAQMFKSMCDTAGIECQYVSGYAGGGSHAWNKVKIGSNWYWVDTTWYDSNGNSKYLLSSTLWSSHKQG